MATESRAEYFRERRKKLKQVAFMVDHERIEKLDAILEKEHLGRTEWFKRMIDEYVSRK